MRNLTDYEREFYTSLLKYSQRLHNGYYVFNPRTSLYGNKKYKVHRIIFMLHYNIYLEPSNIIHHIDGDKTNNDISNLQLINPSNHASSHHAGSIKTGNFSPHNKFSESKDKSILDFIIKYYNENKKINFSEIGKLSKCSGYTAKKKALDNLDYFDNKLKQVIINHPKRIKFE